MGGKQDLTGKRFGKLVVIKEFGRNKWKSVVWLCQCDCGNTNIVATKDLNAGAVKSCGCGSKNTQFQKKKHFGGNKYDLTSQEYGIGYYEDKQFFFDKEDYDKIRKYTWRENERGYIATSLNNYDGKGHNKTMFLHQLVMDSTNSQVIDHKDRNKRNCVKSNLHFTTQQQNILNRPMQKNNTSGYVGVSINKDIKTNKGKKYSAHISKDNKTYSKSFYTIEEAVAWRREMEDKLFSEFYIYKKDKLNE